MEDTKTIESNLDQAQEDLERDLSDLKHVVKGKLEGPRRVVESIRAPIAFARKHALWFGIAGAVVVGALVLTRALRD